MNKEIVVSMANSLRKELGGKIFGFPIEPENPYSSYAVAVYDGKKMKVYPESMGIEESASSILLILEAFEEEGIDSDYERNVRLVSYDSQLNSPNVTMRKVKKEAGSFESTKLFRDDDATPNGEGYNLSARGLIKLSFTLVIDDKNEKAQAFMDGYYSILQREGYGKSVAAIKRELLPMNKFEGCRWIDRTYEKFITDDLEIINLMKKTKSVSH